MNALLSAGNTIMRMQCESSASACDAFTVTSRITRPHNSGHALDIHHVILKQWMH